MTKYNTGDLLGGGFIVLIGLWFVVASSNYQLGTLLSMGPGYFPRMVGMVAMLIGAAVMLTAGREAVASEPIEWRPYIVVSGSIVVFALVVVTFGLLPAFFAATCIAAWADPRSRLLTTLILATVLAVAMSALFVGALDVPVPVLKVPF